MDSRQLRYFLATVDRGSVTRAAEALFVAQPALSQSLRSLESDLGITLFRRVPRGMELTEAGEALVGPARQALASSVHADEVARRIASLETGWLDVACPPDLAIHPLTSLVTRFRLRYPGVRVNVIAPGHNQHVPDLLKSAQCEVGVDYPPVAADKVTSHPIGRRKLVLGFPHWFELSDKPQFPISQLVDVPLVMGPRGSATRDAVERECAARGFAPRVVVEVEREHNAPIMVAAGAGAAFLTGAEAKLAGRRGVRVRQTDPEFGQEYSLVSRTGLLSPAADAFVQLTLGSIAQA